MTDQTLPRTLRALGLVVVVIMAAALVYAGYISLANWAGISV